MRIGILFEFMLYCIVYIEKKQYLCTRKRMDVLIQKKESLRTLRRDDKIRTCDLRSPRPLRYRTAPHPDALKTFPQKRLQRYDFFLI